MSAQRRPGVRTVRGPFLRLGATPGSLRDRGRTRRRSALGFEMRDLAVSSRPTCSAGAGGLSLGLEQAGMQVVLGADHDKEALETHRHHFGWHGGRLGSR